MTAAKTVISASTSYCTTQQLAQFHDWRSLARLCQDEDTAAQESLASFLVDTTALAHLQAASGKLEGAILLGNRYRVLDLQALAGTNAGVWLAEVVAGLAAGTIYERRSGSRITEEEAAKVQRAQETLQALSEGSAILGFQETADAGLESGVDLLEMDLAIKQGSVYQAQRYWGRRAQDWR